METPEKRREVSAARRAAPLLLPLSVVIVAGSLAACRGATPPGSAVLRIALSSEPVSLDPHLQDERTTRAVLGNIYEGLTGFDAEMRLRPILAESWESPSDLRWRFHLRPRVRFHDGRPLAAADMVASLERARHHPHSLVAPFLVAVTRVSALDEVTVEIDTARPYPLLPNKLAYVAILPAGAPDEVTEPVGTGPYQFAGYRKGHSLALLAAAHSWREVPRWREVELRFEPREERRALLLLSGEVDIVARLTGAAAALVEQGMPGGVRSRAGLAVTFLGLRVDRPPGADLRLRRALSLALDRHAIAELTLRGQAEPIGQLVSPYVFGHVPRLAAPARDLEVARRLLAEAALPGGGALALEHPIGMGAEARAIVAQLADAGLAVEPIERPWNELYTRLREGRVDFFLASSPETTPLRRCRATSS